MTEIEWRKIFKDRLSFMMRRANLTRRELVEKSGVSEPAISNYLSGRKTPGIKTTIALAYALGCTIEDLVDYGENIW